MILFVLSFLRPCQTDHHGPSGVECDGDPSDGWVKVLRGRRPPSEQWPLAKKIPTKTEPENHRGRGGTSHRGLRTS